MRDLKKHLTLKDLKADLKKQALNIRALKSKRKESPYGYVQGLESARYDYRYDHVTYCLLRGTLYEDIEKKTNDPIYWPSIEGRMKRITSDLCVEVTV